MTDLVKIALITGIATATPPTMVALGAVVLGFINRTKIVEVAKQTDGVTKSLVAVEKVLSFKEGVAAEKERTDQK
jgi:hypothetical protein